MKPIVKACFALLVLLCAKSNLFAQLSDLHFIPPLKQRGEAFTDQLIYLSTPESSSFQVRVFIGTSTTPVTTLNVSNAATTTYNPGVSNNNITLLTDANTGSVQSNSGLRFESVGGQKFYVNWRGRSVNQASSLTSKGRVALGTAFKWVGAPNLGTNTSLVSNSLGIMATEDNTVVNIFGYDPACTFRLGATEAGITADNLTVTLQRGQTYVLEAPITNAANRSGWIGASITSNKAIAVNIGQMHFQPRSAGTQDCAIDQIIPENTLGKEYIFVRGNGIDDMEFPVIVATQNDTKIFVNGSSTPIATINSGEFFKVPSSNYSTTSASASVPGGNMYVRTSQEAYAVQALAGASSDATADLNFIAPVNCLLANNVNNIPDVSSVAGTTISGGITIIASSAIAEENITVTAGATTVSTATLIAARRTVAGTSEWKTYYLSGLTGNVRVSANGPIAVGYFGFQNVAGASGYFSGFETIPTIEVQRIGDGCLPSTILNATPGFTAYTWFRDGVVVPGITGNSYTPDRAGKFTVTVTNGSCSYTSANQTIFDCNPEIIVQTTANKSGILSGESVQFQVLVRFLGDVDVSNLVLTNPVPSNLTVTSTSATFGTVTNSGATYTWNIGTMRNGEEHILTINATGNSVTVPTPGTLTVSKTQTFAIGTEANKVPDDFSETVTVFSALTAEPTNRPTGLYFTNTGSAHPFNNVLNFSPASGVSGYLILRQVATEPSFVPVDGTSYEVGQLLSGAEVLYIGSDTSITDLRSLPELEYHYVIYPFNGGGAATNYLTSNPLKAVINNRIGNSFAMATAAKSSSAGMANQGVTVTFLNGLGGSGTSISSTRINGAIPPNASVGLPSGYGTVQNLYFTVTSSTASPGDYMIVLDFSSLGLQAADWTTAKLVKRSNGTSPWTDITSLIRTYEADGLRGKLVVGPLNSFSDFAIASPGGILPVQWGGFTAVENSGNVQLMWQTLQESNTQHFEVEYSPNGEQWSLLNTQSAAGNSATTKNYHFLHRSPGEGIHHYRIKQVDADGKFTFSATRVVRLSKKAAGMEVLGNPVTGSRIQIRLTQDAELWLQGSDGRVIRRLQGKFGMNFMSVEGLSKGVYYLSNKLETIQVMIR